MADDEEVFQVEDGLAEVAVVHLGLQPPGAAVLQGAFDADAAVPVVGGGVQRLFPSDGFLGEVLL